MQSYVILGMYEIKGSSPFDGLSYSAGAKKLQTKQRNEIE